MVHFQQFVMVLAFVAAASAEPQGNNEYLPPDKGYTYNKPSVPFPSAPQPQRPSTQYSPPPAPQQPYRPPAPRPQAPRPASPAPRPPVFNNPPAPTYGTPAPAYRPPAPTYGTPAPAYRPPAPQSTFRPPPPAYKPPQPTYNQPPAPTYGPPQTQNTYRPSPAAAPAQQFPSSSGPVGDHSHDHGHGADHVHEAGMPYDFTYAVRAEQAGDAEFSQNEVSDGDQVKGEYRVQLPDGRLQIVRYTADWKTGFHADVSYEGEAKYPDFVPNASRPSPVVADRPSGGYSYPSPGQANPPSSYGPPSTGGPY